ncbi:TonB-dependent receptor [Moraxella osloensis]|uniref:TonB-dependent receptor domain-containing protein n=1 Tax=Faucicola osloensis TaxID=34062 RepID=UPI002004B434|nr:TonB-dependent receptor [Moraxella osloensis]MCK6159458.1 TonB-dependent receptor [Moraxella osloensis]
MNTANASLPPRGALRYLSLCVLTTLYSPLATASEPEPVTTLQTITFNARQYTPAKQTENVRHDSSVKVQQADLLNQYLPTVAGVNVGGTSGMDQHIYIRGLGSDNAGSALKITVDGVRQPETRGFNHSGISGLDPDLYKTTEVSVGNNSVTLGNNAIGGGVAFTTVDAQDLLLPDQKMGAKVKLGYASNDQQFQRSLTTYAKPNEQLDMIVSYGERDSDGGEDGKGNHIQGDDITIKSILAKVNVMPAEGHKITASYQSYDNHGNYPFRPNIGYQANLPNNIHPGYTNNETYALGYEYKPHSNFELNSKIYHLTNESLSQGLRGTTPMRIATSGKTDGMTASIKQQLTQHHGDHALTHTLNYGVEGYKKSATLESSDITEDATSVGVYLQDRIELGRFALTPGVRFDHYKPSERLSSDDYNQLSGALAGEFKLTPNHSLFASYTQLFNGPPLPETVYQSGQTFVNKDLEAETGANAELGISSRFQGVFDSQDSMSLTAKVFDTQYDNKIDRITGVDCATGNSVTGGQCASYINAGETTIKGYELSAKYRLNNMRLNAGYAHAKSETEQGYQLNKDSGDQLNLGFNYDINDKFSLGSAIRHVKGLTRRTSATAVADLPSFTTYDVFGSYRPSALPQLIVDAGVYNLTDAYYYEHVSNTGDKAMGRNVKVALSYQF